MGWVSIVVALTLTGCGRIGFDGSTPGDARSDGPVIDTVVIDGVPRPCTDPAWCPETSGVGDDLAAVWGASPHELWAVGGGGTIVRRTAAGWSRVASDTSANLSAIGGSSAQDVWALGDGLGTHWDGTRWTQRPAPLRPVYGLWAFAPNDVWAVGDDISRWTGTAWAVIPAPGPAYSMRAVWGASATNVYAVGTQGRLLHWDGSVWTQLPTLTPRDLLAIHGTSATDIWVSGGFGVLLHYDGTTWTEEMMSTTQELYGIQVVAPNDAWTIGGGGTLLHYDGTAWSTAASGTTRYLSGLWAHSATELWIVGAVGTIQRGP